MHLIQLTAIISQQYVYTDHTHTTFLSAIFWVYICSQLPLETFGVDFIHWRPFVMSN